MERSQDPAPFADSLLSQYRHVCAFFHNEEEEYRVLLPFIREGFSTGQKAVHVVNPGQRDDHLARLADNGIDIEGTQASGQLELLSNRDTYIVNGRFDPDRMLKSFERMASGNTNGDFPFSRIICRMDWASGSQQDIENLVEFESRVNELWQQHDDIVICTYYLAKFGGDTVVDILRTHPMIIIGGILQHNPFFVPPQQFLHELKQRRMSGPKALSKVL